MTIGGVNPDLLLGHPRLDEPVDYGPYDRDKWIRCAVCGKRFADDRDFESHSEEDADE